MPELKFVEATEDVIHPPPTHCVYFPPLCFVFAKGNGSRPRIRRVKYGCGIPRKESNKANPFLRTSNGSLRSRGSRCIETPLVSGSPARLRTPSLRREALPTPTVVFGKGTRLRGKQYAWEEVGLISLKAGVPSPCSCMRWS